MWGEIVDCRSTREHFLLFYCPSSIFNLLTTIDIESLNQLTSFVFESANKSKKFHQQLPTVTHLLSMYEAEVFVNDSC